MEQVEHIHKNENTNPDSMEWGSSAKGTCCKVYGDFNKPEEFQKKIENAIRLKDIKNKIEAEMSVQTTQR